MRERPFRLFIGAVVPPVVAAFCIKLAFEWGASPRESWQSDYSLIVWVVLILGFIPSLLYSLAMEHLVKRNLVENNSKGTYLFMSGALGGAASSIPFFGPWLLIGIIIGLGVGYILMKSVIREQADTAREK